MKRRDFMALLGGAAAWPLAARAQQGGKIWRIGWLSGSSPESASVLVSAFLQGMRELVMRRGETL
jgi:putative ABC transport system substrate-binding protein